jgi:DNA (cytosine-5)-methyltransferase 1
MTRCEDTHLSYEDHSLIAPDITAQACLSLMEAGLLPSHEPRKTFAEFFAGIGLIRLTLERQGWDMVYANDIDPKKKRMYEAHFQDTQSCFHLGDIHEIPPEQVPTVTLATVCFPCNDLSLAGARSGLSGKQSSSFWGFIRVIEGMGTRRPPIILLENMPGFLTSRNGQDFHEATLALNKLGYSVDAFVVDALLFVPQSRQRLFVIGIMDGVVRNEEIFDPDIQESILRPRRLTDFIKNHPDIRWNIRRLPGPVSRKVSLKDILDDLPDDAEEWWAQERAERLVNQMSPRHRKVATDMIAGSNWSYGTVFRRIRNKKSMAELRTDGVAGCLRTPRGGSGWQILFKAGHGKYFFRLLTPRECARLMGADDYRIEVPLNQALFGFGDAVCVPVIEWIAQHYLNPVANELYARRSQETDSDPSQWPISISF